MTKKKKIIIIVFSVVFVLFAGVIGGGIYALNWYCADIEPAQTVSVETNSKYDSVRLIAHRGLSAVAPENTLPAYTKAGEAGFWGAECDIYRTTDGK